MNENSSSAGPTEPQALLESGSEAEEHEQLGSLMSPRLSQTSPRLDRQGTFKQGKSGGLDQIQLNLTPRGSRSHSTNDLELLDQTKRVSIVLDATTEQLQEEEDAFPESMVSTYEPHLRNAVLERQGTFVQWAGGQGGHVALSTGSEVRNSLKEQSHDVLSSATVEGDEDDEPDDGDEQKSPSESDEEEEPDEEDEPQSYPLALTSHAVGGTESSYAGPHHLAASVTSSPATTSGNAVAAPCLQTDTSLASSETQEEDDDDQHHHTDNGGDHGGDRIMAPIHAHKKGFVVSEPQQPKHNRSGTFMQSSSGKALALDLSTGPRMDISEIVNSNRATMTTIVDTNNDVAVEDDDAGSWRPSLQRKGTFMQSPSGTSKAISISNVTSVQVSHSGLSVINDDENDEEELLDNLASFGQLDVTESSHLPPVFQRKGTFMQAESGETHAIVINGPTTEQHSKFSRIGGCRVIQEGDEQAQRRSLNDVGEQAQRRSLNDVDNEDSPIQNRVNQQKRQAYLENRKGTFTADKEGKMFAVQLAAENRIGAASQGISISEETVDDDEDTILPEAERKQDAPCDWDSAEVSNNVERQARIRTEDIVGSDQEKNNERKWRQKPPSSMQGSIPHVHQDERIRKMFASAEHDRQLRHLHLQGIEKVAMKSRSRQPSKARPPHDPIALGPVQGTRIRSVKANPPLDPTHKWMRPTSAERFVQTYKVYSNAMNGIKLRCKTVCSRPLRKKKQPKALMVHGKRFGVHL